MLISYQEFLRGKRKRKDVAKFGVRLMDNILALHFELCQKTYRHGGYYAFKINDPKSREIHKASVSDRLLHHAIYRILYSHFDRKFIYDSYSCRKNKGIHRAINRFRELASIDHKILKNILGRYIKDTEVLWLLGQVIDSFNTKGKRGVGLPLGNLTSQLLVNIYMNEFDNFLKRTLKVKYCIRYADDFVVFHKDEFYLENLIPQISDYLETRLKLSLNPGKLLIKTLASGVDFLGWVHFPQHRILRISTKKRMFKKLRQYRSDTTVTSYLGLLKHGNTYKLIKWINNTSRS